MKKFFQEFKEFIMKGNVIDMAVGVIIGAAFKDIVTSLTNNIISPILGIFGGVDFNEYKWVISTKEVINAEGVAEIVENSINYGSFITAVINFLIMAFIIFCLVKLIAGVEKFGKNITKKKAEEEVPPAPTTKICPFCKSEIAIEATRCPHCTSELSE
ncbi:MAG: large conductance mechanosensitive channel protein MscL [Oscillospiraceae bacterium]|nr:large conductance mechanosensitive channel protein MscL [Clostridia bacterium]MBQ5321632.1 large conductance mechanosensitive channel protein MscL [Oscillospiraceae bacterium]